MPTIKCKINVNSGCINKIMVIATDENTIDSIYDYNLNLLRKNTENDDVINMILIDYEMKSFIK